MGQGSRTLLVRLKLGHCSELLPVNNELGHTHRWTVFVRSSGPNEFTDRSFISKVCFQLHPDFPSPKRVVKEPPFEVTETGYAGFVIPVTIHFAGTKHVYNLDYDFNLTMEKRATYTTYHVIEVKDVSSEFAIIGRGYGAEKRRSREKEPNAEGTVTKKKRDYDPQEGPSTSLAASSFQLNQFSPASAALFEQGHSSKPSKYLLPKIGREGTGSRDASRNASPRMKGSRLAEQRGSRPSSRPSSAAGALPVPSYALPAPTIVLPAKGARSVSPSAAAPTPIRSPPEPEPVPSTSTTATNGAPHASEIDLPFLHRSLQSVRDPSVLFDVACFLVDHDPSARVSLSRCSLSYDLSLLDSQAVISLQRLLSSSLPGSSSTSTP